MGDFYNRKYLVSYRRKLRNKSTAAESSLWSFLKNKQVGGLKFRRQHSIGIYIVDFICPQIKLIIELDGASHDNYLAEEKDEIRDAYLNKYNYTVLRFENKTVYEFPGDIISSILDYKKVYFNE